MVTKPLNLTIEKLRSMLAAADDNAGHHILWIDTEGNVALAGPFSPESDERASWLEENEKHIALRHETLCQGLGDCGPEFAADSKAVTKLFNFIADSWTHWTPRSPLNRVMGNP
jgi:hypothetical protein